jgi:carbamoyltransferase
MYEVFCLFLGFDRFEGPGKVMGLAALGNPETYLNFFKSLVTFKEQGKYEIDKNIYLYYVTEDKKYLKKIISFLGEQSVKGNGESQRDRDVAAGLQRITEEIVLHIAKHLYEKTKSENIVMAGGVALNSVANDRVIKETGFKNIFIQPAADDSGTSMGAALYYYHSVLGNPRKYIMTNAYLGPQYSDIEIEKVLKEKNINYKKSDNIPEETAKFLFDGNVVAWFQGKMEWGPRALGSRSILADPRNNSVKEDLNVKVKRREIFRPFAPSVLEEKAKEYFNLNTEAPYMLLVCDVYQDKRLKVPAIVHVDGSARPQTVSKKESPLYYEMIEKFEKLSVIPMVLNTSFNIQEPIVCNPEQALETFLKSKMDYLVIGNFIVSRDENGKLQSEKKEKSAQDANYSRKSIREINAPKRREHKLTLFITNAFYYTFMAVFVYFVRIIK